MGAFPNTEHRVVTAMERAVAAFEQIVAYMVEDSGTGITPNVEALHESALVVVRAFNEHRVPTLAEASWASAAVARFAIATGRPLPDAGGQQPFDDVAGDAAEYESESS